MSIFRILLYVFLIYLAYKIIFDLIIPVYRTTKQVKKGFKEMNERMNEHIKQQSSYAKASENRQEQAAQPEQPKKPTEKSGDYIEYEEIK
jgi:Sec-independent protein translocase protein TatA